MSSIQVQDQKVLLWNGTLVDRTLLSGSATIWAEVAAACEDFQFLLNDKTMFAMRYDPGSFSKEVTLWLQSHFEPAVNCVAKRQLLTLEEDEDQYLLMTVHKTQEEEEEEEEEEEKIAAATADADE